MKRPKTNANSSFYTVLLDTLPEAITMVNRDGFVIEWNPAAEKMYGIPKETIIGRHISEFFRRNSLMLLHVMETALPVYGVYHQPRPDKHVFIHTMPVTSPDDVGSLIGAISIEQSITDVVKLSEERYSQQFGPDSQDLPATFDTSNPALKKELVLLETIIQTKPQASLLFTGESGVGKAILAKYVHTRSLQTGPFMTVSCDAFPNGLLDIELFGHEETGRAAKLEVASQGTLYLRNIDQMAQKTQIKLAETMHNGGFQRFHTNGEQTWIPLTCRIITSSSITQADTIDGQIMDNKNITQQLYFQFHIVDIPALRNRREDLPQLCRTYLSHSAQKLNKPIPQVSSEVMATFATYSWPGNLVEFIRVIDHLVIVATDDEPVRLLDLPKTLRPKTMTELTNAVIPLSALSKEMEREKIELALTQTSGNKSNAAKLLGISRGALYYKLRQYELRSESSQWRKQH